jgi:hypothetical protein
MINGEPATPTRAGLFVLVICKNKKVRSRCFGRKRCFALRDKEVDESAETSQQHAAERSIDVRRADYVMAQVAIPQSQSTDASSKMSPKDVKRPLKSEGMLHLFSLRCLGAGCHALYYSVTVMLSLRFCHRHAFTSFLSPSCFHFVSVTYSCCSSILLHAMWIKHC